MDAFEFACGTAVSIIIVINLLLFDMLLCANIGGLLMGVSIPMSIFACRRIHEVYIDEKNEYL